MGIGGAISSAGKAMWSNRSAWSGAITRGAGVGAVGGGVVGGINGLGDNQSFFGGVANGALHGAFYGAVGYGGYRAARSTFGGKTIGSKVAEATQDMGTAAGVTRAGVGKRRYMGYTYQAGAKVQTSGVSPVYRKFNSGLKGTSGGTIQSSRFRNKARQTRASLRASGIGKQSISTRPAYGADFLSAAPSSHRF